MNKYDFKFVGRFYDYYEVRENYIRVLFLQYEEETKSSYFYELQVYDPEQIEIIKTLSSKQMIGVLGHYEEIINHPDHGLSTINVELVADTIFTSFTK